MSSKEKREVVYEKERSGERAVPVYILGGRAAPAVTEGLGEKITQ